MSQLGVAVLGSTGSVGKSTLDILAQYPDTYNVIALSAYQSVDVCFEQCVQFRPSIVVMVDDIAARSLRDKLQKTQLNIEVLSGNHHLDMIASLPDVNIVVAAIVGSAGLSSSLAAAASGKKILLANKESLVMSGQLFMDTVKKNQATLLPVDSEHNALFQCLPDHYTPGQCIPNLKKLLLTASGGPFFKSDQAVFEHITPEQACNHPTWKMGKKISIDSATLMNKGLEVIEAHWLFNVPSEQIEVIVHPQSVVHSMVEYTDGTVLAQMGTPDMRVPIGYSLAWPNRIKTNAKALNFYEMGDLSFHKPDKIKFPCLQYAYDALNAGGAFPLVLNAVNEEAVSAFIDRKIKFLDIPNIIDKVLNQFVDQRVDTIEAIEDVNVQARKMASEIIMTLAKGY